MVSSASLLAPLGSPLHWLVPLRPENDNINTMSLASRMIVCGALLALLVALSLASAQSADAPARQSSADSMPVDVDRGAAGLTRWLRALQTRASLLMITAPSDDEGGGMLVPVDA